MATTRKTGRGSSSKRADRPRKRSRPRSNGEPLAAADIKCMPKAPADYEGIARKFADALESTRFRGAVSANKLRTMVARGERLAQRAAAAQLAATAADRRRIAQESQAWKSMLSTWRLIVAAMPERVELQEPFAFMQVYMSVSRTPAAPAQTPAPTS